MIEVQRDKKIAIVIAIGGEYAMFAQFVR